jgi:biotin carboxyl carrier protein
VEDIVKTYRITVEGRTFDVQVRGDPRARQVEVEVNGLPLTVAVESLSPEPTVLEAPAPPTAVAAAPPRAAAAPAGVATKVPAAAANSVTAPLPGVIKRIAVQPGQRVAAGETLLVIEAMKMDNVLRAARDGVVAKVHAVEGRQVAHGAPLLEYQV